MTEKDPELKISTKFVQRRNHKDIDVSHSNDALKTA